MPLLKKEISTGNLKTKHLYFFKNYLGSSVAFRNNDLNEYLSGIDAGSNSVYNLANKLKLCGNEVTRLHEEAGCSIKRWSLTPGQYK